MFFKRLIKKKEQGEGRVLTTRFIYPFISFEERCSCLAEIFTC